MATVSIAMIVRNEAENLPACLESVRGLWHELVIVDTGSSDDTKRIARRFGARVYDFNWCDDFSAARNFGLDRVRTDYVWRMDADDRLPSGQRKRMARLIQSLRADCPTAYAMRVEAIEEGGRRGICDEWRLWPHAPNRRFVGAVHERIEATNFDIALEFSDVRLEHHGYSTPEMIYAKLLRNLAISQRQIDAGHTGEMLLFDHGRTLAALGANLDAVRYLRTFLKVRNPRYDMAGRLAYRLLVELHDEDPLKALEIAREGLALFPDDSPLYLLVADRLAEAGVYYEAAEGYHMALRHYRPGRMDSGIRTDFTARVKAALERIESASLSTTPAA